MWKKKLTLPKKCVWVFLNVLGNKALKTRAITLHGNKTNLCQELALKFFELIIYQNTKTHAKQALWRNRITLSKNVYFQCFFII